MSERCERTSERVSEWPSRFHKHFAHCGRGSALLTSSFQSAEEDFSPIILKTGMNEEKDDMREKARFPK